MSVIPLLVSIFLFSIYFPHIARVPFSKLEIILFFSVSVVIAIVGFFVAKQIVDSIITISTEAQNIAKGQIDTTISVDRQDEIGDLSNALNQLTGRIRDNMDELRNYGERTREINAEINKRVIILSGLLQISNLITQGSDLNDIFAITVSKLSQLKNSAWTLLVLQDANGELRINSFYGLGDFQLESLRETFCKRVFDIVILHKGGLTVGKDAKDQQILDIKEFFMTDNIMLMPVLRHAKIIGFLGMGNSHEDGAYTNEDLELLILFAKQLAIGIENDYLTNRISRLEVKDPLTGIYNKSFVVNRLAEEIKRAIIYQRPCAFLIASIDKFQDFAHACGELAKEEALKKVATILSDSISEIDRVARYADTAFAIVLPEKNKKQTMEFSENLRKKVESHFAKESEAVRRFTLSIGVSENPIDGSCAEDLITKAEQLLATAQKATNTVKS